MGTLRVSSQLVKNPTGGSYTRATGQGKGLIKDEVIYRRTAPFA